MISFSITKTAFAAFVAGGAFAFLLAGMLVSAQWSGPSNSPPNDNVDTPLHQGIPEQWKDAGLEVNITDYNTTGLKVNGYLQVDAVTGTPPSGDCSSGFEGRMKYDPATNTLYICDGSTWQIK